MDIFSEEVINDFAKDVLAVEGYFVISKENTITVLPIDQYKKYISDYHDSVNMNIETFEVRGYGYVLESRIPGIYVGDRIHYLPMLGVQVHLNPKIDISVKVLTNDDWVIKESKKDK